MFLHNLLNVPVQVANKMGLKKVAGEDRCSMGNIHKQTQASMSLH
jgi:hypothetical protein